MAQNNWRSFSCPTVFSKGSLHVSLQKSPGCNYENIKLIFFCAYARLFNDESLTFNIHQFYRFLSYLLKMVLFGVTAQQNKPFYARTQTGYLGYTPNVPVQLLESSHLQQAAKHAAITKNGSHCQFKQVQKPMTLWCSLNLLFIKLLTSQTQKLRSKN